MSAKYSFPYHHLADTSSSNWKAQRNLSWGYEYMGYLEAVVEEIKSLDPQNLLEIGCGDGRLIAELLNGGISGTTGIDIDERAVLFAKAFNFGQEATIQVGDIREMEGLGFDGAVAMEVIEHIPDAELPSIIKAIWDRTTSGAFFLVSVPTTNVPVTPAHFRHYDLELLQQHLGPYFSIESSRYLHRPGMREKFVRKFSMNRLFLLNEPRMLRAVRSLYRRLTGSATASNGSHLLAIARRVSDPAV